MDKKLFTSSIISTLLSTLLALPMIALAQAGPPAPGLPGVVTGLWQVVTALLGFIWPLFIGVSIIMFIVAAFTFVTANGDPGKVKLARDAVIYGIIGVVVGILAFSLPYIIGCSLNGGVGGVCG